MYSVVDIAAIMKFLLLALVATTLASQANGAASEGFSGAWNGGLSVRFGIGLFPGRSFFISVPQTLAAAKNQRWVESPRPAGQPRQGLVLYNPSINDVVLGAFYDDSGAVAGLQIALPQDSFVDDVLDWETQGFTAWTAPANSQGVRRTYWTTAVYFVSDAALAKSPTERIAERKGRVLGEDSIYVTGINGELMPISVDASKVADTATTHFNRQACVILMGTHYYYNTTTQSECNSKSLLPWFALVDHRANQLIGTGFVSFGKLPESALVRDYFERPTRANVEMIVPEGPECLYELAENYGLVTMHIYYVDTPLLINCLFQG